MSSDFQLPPERPLPSGRQAAARSQLERYATSRRERISQLWRRGALVLGLGLGLTVAGAATAGTIYLTKGPVPTVNGTLDFQKAPDYITVIWHGKLVGYVPKGYVSPSPVNTPANRLLGAVAPVYGSDLKKLVGHMYPGVGFVPLGKSITSVACMPATMTDNGTTSTTPCPSVTATVPSVVGLNTPTGVVKVQAAGLTPIPQNEHSRTVPNGDVIGTSPSAGTRVPARTQVTVFNSLGP
jgi:hypothetical protein